ncbi:competence type IV pilus minor pilin ComGF [Planomicrobium sp. YIM 101495]|uniref:competence type IV pilus minor pilin ComGF n=1 Tax=Planomicrobium sp. YIM 101495 TaxID=2665160 RepID=UPI0018A8BDA8|nr:competence type IV pilus minor pilin ComGF [Planomicrobium sp. YIM 101495]
MCSQKGFTFLSSLTELMILLLLLPLITLFFLVAGSISEALDPKQLEWELFTADFRSYLNDVESIEVINRGTGIRTVRGEDEFAIGQYEQLIRKQRFEKGHEIMLTGVKECRFELQDGYLAVRVIFTNGLEKDEQYAVTLFVE